MNLKVYYVSPKGCAEMVAETIARTCQCTKEPLLPAYMPERVPLMFIGCDGSKADKVTMDFINKLNKDRVHKAALFCCNSGLSDAPIAQMRAALTERGIPVVEEALVLPGKGLFGGKKPGDADLAKAKTFAEACIAQIK